MYTHRLSVARANAPATSSTKIISSSSSCWRVLGSSLLSPAPDDSFRSHPLAHSRSFRESTGYSGKTTLLSVVVHRRVPLLGRTVTREYCNPRDIPKLQCRILHRYRYYLSGGRQSDITVHQNSPHRQRPREIIPIIGQSIFRREIDVTRLSVHLRRDRIEITVDDRPR